MTKMSSSMEDRMMKLETTVDNIKENVDEHKRLSSEQHKALSDKLDKFIESADKKYATKLSEVIVYALCGIILTGFVVYLVKTAFG